MLWEVGGEESHLAVGAVEVDKASYRLSDWQEFQIKV